MVFEIDGAWYESVYDRILQVKKVVVMDYGNNVLWEGRPEDMPKFCIPVHVIAKEYVKSVCA